MKSSQPVIHYNNPYMSMYLQMAMLNQQYTLFALKQLFAPYTALMSFARNNSIPATEPGTHEVIVEPTVAISQMSVSEPGFVQGRKKPASKPHKQKSGKRQD